MRSRLGFRSRRERRSYDDLPEDVLCLIFERVSSVRDRLACSLVSRHWNQVVRKVSMPGRISLAPPGSLLATLIAGSSHSSNSIIGCCQKWLHELSRYNPPAQHVWREIATGQNDDEWALDNLEGFLCAWKAALPELQVSVNDFPLLSNNAFEVIEMIKAMCLSLPSLRLLCTQPTRDIMGACADLPRVEYEGDLAEIVGGDDETATALESLASPLELCSHNIVSLRLNGRCTRSLLKTSQFSSFTNLVNLELLDAPMLSDLSGLSSCKMLQSLTVDYGIMSDVSPLTACQELRQIRLHHCLLLEDISALGDCGKLIDVDLSRCAKARDIVPLCRLKELTRVDLSYTLVFDHTPLLQSCPLLCHINIEATPAKYKQIVQNRQGRNAHWCQLTTLMAVPFLIAMLMAAACIWVSSRRLGTSSVCNGLLIASNSLSEE